MSVGNTKRGQHGYGKTALGLWATIGPDLDLGAPPKQQSHLKIDQGKGSGGTSNYSDPVDFLLSLEKANTRTKYFNTASQIPLQAANSPSLRKIGTIERQKWNAHKAHEASLIPITNAHSSGKDYEKTSLGLFATLPTKDHGPEFE
jgi:hypothetical protein